MNGLIVVKYLVTAGVVVAVRGSVVDVRFDHVLPPIYSLLRAGKQSHMAIEVLARSYPLLTVRVTPFWIAAGGLLGIAAGILGALYPAWLAARQDPVLALAHE